MRRKVEFRTVSVLGAGAWGTALANVAARAGHPVHLWGRDPAAMASLARTRENPHLPGVTLDERVTPLADLGEAASGDLLLAVVPAQATRDLTTRLGGLVAPG